MSKRTVTRWRGHLPAWSHHQRPGVTLAVLALLLRVAGLITRPEWGDEQITARIVTTYTPSEIAVNVAANQPHFPTYYLLVDAWTTLTGLSPYTAQWTSALASALAVYVLYELVRLDADTTTAGVAAGLLAISPVAVSYGAWLRMYALVLLATVWSWYELRRHQHDTGSWLRWGTATLVGVALHPFGFLTLAAQAAWLGVSRRPRGWLRAAAAVGVASSPFAAYLAVKALRVAPDAAGTAGQVSHLTTPSGWRVFATPLGLLLGRLATIPHLIVGTLVAVIVATTVLAARTRLDSLSVVWLAVPLIGAALLSVHQPVFQLKYLGAVTTPAACVLAGRTLSRRSAWPFLAAVLGQQLYVLGVYLTTAIPIARYTLP